MKFSWCFVYVSVTLATLQRATADEIVSKDDKFTSPQIDYLDLKKYTENYQRSSIRSNVQPINKKAPPVDTTPYSDQSRDQIPPIKPSSPSYLLPINLYRFTTSPPVNTADGFTTTTASPSRFGGFKGNVTIARNRSKILDPSPLSFWRTNEIEKESVVEETPPPNTQTQQIQELEKRVGTLGNGRGETDQDKSNEEKLDTVIDQLPITDQKEPTTEPTTSVSDQSSTGDAELQILNNEREQQTDTSPIDADDQLKTGVTTTTESDPKSKEENILEPEVGSPQQQNEQSQQEAVTPKTDPIKLEESFRKNEPPELDLSPLRGSDALKQKFSIPDVVFSKPNQKTTKAAETIAVSPETTELTSPVTEKGGQDVEEADESGISKSSTIPQVPQVSDVPHVSINEPREGDENNAAHKDTLSETFIGTDDHDEPGTVTELGGEPGNLEQDHHAFIANSGVGGGENENLDARKLVGDITEKQQTSDQKQNVKQGDHEEEADSVQKKSKIHFTERQQKLIQKESANVSEDDEEDARKVAASDFTEKQQKTKQSQSKNKAMSEDDDGDNGRNPVEDRTERQQRKKQKQLKTTVMDEDDEDEDEEKSTNEKTDKQQKQQKNKIINEDEDEEEVERKQTVKNDEKQRNIQKQQKIKETDDAEEEEGVDSDSVQVNTKKQQKTRQRQQKTKVVNEDEEEDEEGQKTNLIDETKASSDTQLDLENSTETVTKKKVTTASTTSTGPIGFMDSRLSSPVKPERVDIKQLPFMAISVTRLNHEKYKRCAATVISEYHVLSAAHCYFDREEVVIPSRVMIVAAQTQSDINKLGPHTQLRVGEDVSIFPGYGPLLFDAMIKDIAVVKVRKPFEFNQYLKPVLFRTTPMPSTDAISCFMPGWNITDSKSKLFSTNQLSRINATVGLTNTCPCLHWLHSRGLVCPDRETEFSICDGDYGGPLICDNEMVGVAHGLVSENCSERIKDSEDVCSLDKVTVYVNLCPYLGWLSGYVRELRELDDFPCSDPDSAISHAAHTLITGLLLLIILKLS